MHLRLVGYGCAAFGVEGGAECGDPPGCRRWEVGAGEGEYRVSWTTVRKALGSTRPTERKQYPNRGSKIDDYREVIDGGCARI